MQKNGNVKKSISRLKPIKNKQKKHREKKVTKEFILIMAINSRLRFANFAYFIKLKWFSSCRNVTDKK